MLLNILDRKNGFNKIWSDLQRFDHRDTENIFGESYLNASTFPAVNVYQNENSAILTALVPGFEPESIEINVKENRVELSGKTPENEFAKEADSIRGEILNSSFKRNIELGFRINPQTVEAKYKNGILTLTLPKAESEKPKKILVSLDE